MKVKLFIILLLVCLISPCVAEEITFELYAIKDGERELIASGTRTYSESDVKTKPEFRDGDLYGVRKVLDLHDGLGIGFLDTFDNLGGFGLTVERLPVGSRQGDHSWEWYDPQTKRMFSKRRGQTLVDVKFNDHPPRSEIRQIVFVENADLWYVQDAYKRLPWQGPTHILRIRSGSVLLFPQITKEPL